MHLHHLALNAYLSLKSRRILLSRMEEYVKEHYTIAQDALWWWKFHNKPKSGEMYHSTRSNKTKFKYALRSVRRNKKMIKADAMASDVLNHDNGYF